MAAVEKDGADVGIAMTTRIVGTSDKKFSTTFFVGSATKMRRTTDDLLSKF